ncbi:MAG: hypothetical protein M1814_002972 [Vezdaea aestivalis]|nr:MAG: hypothetical protein M1814_002972 [Vezdaea aestivalis]
MPPLISSLFHLPNGQTLTVSPSFGGFSFRPTDLNVHKSALPPGWSIIINTSHRDADEDPANASSRPASRPHSGAASMASIPEQDETLKDQNHVHAHKFTHPTLRRDNMFISSIVNPATEDFVPARSPTRQVALMLWASLYWYFHQPEPAPQTPTAASAKTPISGQPKGDWRINIKREGIFRGRALLSKLERMGIVCSEDTTVGLDGDQRSGQGWNEMFMSRRNFWQLDARIYLFTLEPADGGQHSPFVSSSPFPSRPVSPSNDGTASPRPLLNQAEANNIAQSQGLWAPSSPGPFTSGSHIPTYYPPPPLQYAFSNGLRHPIRPKPPRQGETFYTRYVPSFSQFLTFRVVSLSRKAPAQTMPISSQALTQSLEQHPNVESLPGISNLSLLNISAAPNDLEYIHKWMNIARVYHFWGEQGPMSKQEQFLKSGLMSRHSFPVIGCWDGAPFGYFEIYWVKEDILGRHLDDGGHPFDRGIHALVGEDRFRGPTRVKAWLSSLIHYCFLADNRTQSVVLEPRVDNKK